ncbi:hypothetical protein FWK35_00022062 [Aphis craccivora]|uniref:Mos1 transposase HTH domain-containing protein n=1 Tax=Aphis craccivora TaxID=307492 RepID=A0A6G0Z8X3_APHCR|nr:hypothetical protein FWK35_00022062 [Aphis craccivora]
MRAYFKINFRISDVNSAAQIYRWLCAIYGYTVTSDDLELDWCRQFENESTDVHNEVDQGTQHRIVSENLVYHKFCVPVRLFQNTS